MPEVESKESKVRPLVLPWRSRTLVVWRIQLVVLIFLVLWPVSYGFTRLAIALMAVITFASAWWLFDQRPWVRRACIAVPMAFAIPFLMPGRVVSPDILRQEYLGELRKYDGVRYVWGGENRFGIDCSGLVRKAFINSRVRVGLRTGNGALLREALLSWWYDASARALMSEYRDETRRLFEAPNIRLLKTDGLRAGDLAVTSDGIHVLAYLGHDRWIEADPHAGRVIEIGSQDSSAWLVMPVEIVRWRRLE